MPNIVVPACMLYVAAGPMHGLLTPLPFVNCTVTGPPRCCNVSDLFTPTVSKLKITACLLEFRCY